MPLEIPQLLLALAILAAAASGLWLMLHARDVALLFRRSGVIEPAPGPRLASRNTTIAMLAAFNLAWIAAVAIWSLSTSDEAAEAVNANSAVSAPENPSWQIA